MDTKVNGRISTAGSTVQSGFRQSRAAENVAAADHTGDLHAALLDLDAFRPRCA